jgi:hypothetical protein
VNRFRYGVLNRFRKEEGIEMLEVLVAIDVAQRRMRQQFEMEAPTGTNVHRAEQKHRSPFRTAFGLVRRSEGSGG